MCVCVCVCVCVSCPLIIIHGHSEFTQDQRDEASRGKMTGKREIEREREVWCEKTKAGGEDRGKRKDRG